MTEATDQSINCFSTDLDTKEIKAMINIKQPLSRDKEDELVKTRIQFVVPQKHHEDPIICSLILDFKLKVNLKAAILGKDGVGGGCFDLELEGYQEQIDLALAYLSQLNVEIWQKSENDFVNW